MKMAIMKFGATIASSPKFCGKIIEQLRGNVNVIGGTGFF